MGDNIKEITKLDAQHYKEQKTEFFKDPTKYIKDNNIKTLLYSPSITVGVDINIDFVSKVFCFFKNGSINHEMMF
jgi:type IV secretory pathway VirB9-like protein